MRAWYGMARKCSEDYGSHVDYEEDFFICPECGEPMLVEDWPKHNWDICPICGFEFFSE